MDATARVDLDPAALDAADPLARFRDRSAPLEPGLVYLDGNSLGRPTKAAIERVTAVAEGWATRVIRGWDEGWLELPLRVGDLLARGVLGARPGEVLVTDSTTVNLYRLASAALDARPGRRAVLIERSSSRPTGTSPRDWPGSEASRSAGSTAMRSTAWAPATFGPRSTNARHW